MSSKSSRETEYMLNTLQRHGISRADAEALRRISMTLNRWFELECGSDHGHIERDETTGKPYMVYHVNTSAVTGGYRKSPIADREKGAEKRLAAIMSRINSHTNWCAAVAPIPFGAIAEHGPCNCGMAERGQLSAYIQTDPRGCALYIIRPDDVPAGAEVDSYYSRGLAVYK